MAALGSEFAGAAIFAAAVDLAVAGSDAAAVALPVAASAGFADFDPLGSIMLAAFLSVPAYLALLACFPLLFAFSGTSSVLGTFTEAFIGSVKAPIVAFTVL